MAEQRRRMGLPPLPQGFDPRRAIDPAAMERMMRAQAVARAQAQAATTVVIGTIVTLVSSAFGFVAALAWNDAINVTLNNFLQTQFGVDPTKQSSTISLLRAVIFTVIAIIAIFILQRVAGRWAKKAAITAAAGEGSY
ncbi:MAG TPA: DUF5654 family protein [Ktedonobacterales bacterium]|nr:DUF5654 family protein [Ktedonobacterales bacterium]